MPSLIVYHYDDNFCNKCWIYLYIVSITSHDMHMKWNHTMIAMGIAPKFFSYEPKKLQEHFFPSIHLSITTFWQCSCYRIILKFSGVIITDRHDVIAKGQGQSSNIKVTEVMKPLSRFRTITPVWIHIWEWNDAQSLMLLTRGAVLFFKVIHQF